VIPDRLNYLHRADAVDYAAALDVLPRSGLVAKEELRRIFEGRSSSAPAEILRAYGRTVNIESFRRELLETVKARKLFQRLRCRGFSYSVWHNPSLHDQDLRADVDIRLALVPEHDLFYPIRLRRYLRRGNSNHVRSGAFESIAFALATVKDRRCDLLIMQSDLARRRPSYVREHFRGWRKILFLIVANVVMERADTICVFRASDVARACDPRFTPTSMQIAAWRSIYERTAADFGLALTELERPADLQIYMGMPSVPATLGYVGWIRDTLKQYGGEV
jgi:hypothetical protein